MKVSWYDDVPNTWKNNKMFQNVPNQQSSLSLSLSYSLIQLLASSITVALALAKKPLTHRSDKMELPTGPEGIHIGFVQQYNL